MKIQQKDIQEYKMLQQSPIYFVKKVWGLTLHPVLPEYQQRLFDVAKSVGDEWEEKKNEIDPTWFGATYDEKKNVWYYPNFVKGKHMTWQQWLILLSMEKALKKEAQRSLSIASGRGIGKSATLSWIMLWFLFSFPDCQIPCTAPGQQQMYDVLWKEIALWISRMPTNIRNLYEWESSHVRIKESPYTWFARAKTASKENPEALSGVHADWVLALADEASAVDDPIFEAAQGIFSSPNAFLVMISNPTRRNGYFFRSHHQSKENFQAMQFASNESPIVDEELVKRYSDDGIQSDKFRINVAGLFPTEDAIDGKSYIQLVSEHLIKMDRPLELKFREPILGIDPSGEGDNQTAYCIRDNFFAEIVGQEDGSSSKAIAQSVLTLADKYRIEPKNIVVDAFGTGHDIGKELALSVRWDIHTANIVEKPDDEDEKELFLNKRAMMFWKMKLWLEKGGILVENRRLKEQILSIKFRRNLTGKIEIMPKREMRAAGIPSPDLADALALTFLRTSGTTNNDRRQKAVLEAVPFNRWGI